jgi:hypothetical protein
LVNILSEIPPKSKPFVLKGNGRGFNPLRKSRGIT